MFFFISKVFWFFAQPPSLLGTGLAVGLGCLLLKRRRTAIWVLSLSLGWFALIGLTNFGEVLVEPLENRFPLPSPPDKVSAIVVLGGAVDPHISKLRGTIALADAAERMTETLVLARRYPESKVIFTGGSAELAGPQDREATAAGPFFLQHGLDPSRLILEPDSRNTDENAIFVKRLLDQMGPSDGVVLLVTSGYHMPRSVGLFRAKGVKILPWPVDYRTTGKEWLGVKFDPNGNFGLTSLAVREWIGLVAYRLSGRIAHVLPGPKDL